MAELQINHAALDDLGDGAHPAMQRTQEIERQPETRMNAQTEQQEPIAKVPAQGTPKMTTIILEEGDHIAPGGQPVGHNGTFYLIKPGVEQSVPEHVLNVLNDAIMEKPIMSPDGARRVGWRKMLRFPYRVVS